jgi:hypothetical protein
MMTFRTQARMALVTSIGLCASFAVALAQSDTETSDGLETPPPDATAEPAQDEEAGGFWDWVKNNIEIEDTDDGSQGNHRDDNRGGDSGGGGGHGG